MTCRVRSVKSLGVSKRPLQAKRRALSQPGPCRLLAAAALPRPARADRSTTLSRRGGFDGIGLAGTQASPQRELTICHRAQPVRTLCELPDVSDRAQAAAVPSGGIVLRLLRPDRPAGKAAARPGACSATSRPALRLLSGRAVPLGVPCSLETGHRQAPSPPPSRCPRAQSARRAGPSACHCLERRTSSRAARDRPRRRAAAPCPLRARRSRARAPPTRRAAPARRNSAHRAPRRDRGGPRRGAAERMALQATSEGLCSSTWLRSTGETRSSPRRTETWPASRQRRIASFPKDVWPTERNESVSPSTHRREPRDRQSRGRPRGREGAADIAFPASGTARDRCDRREAPLVGH